MFVLPAGRAQADRASMGARAMIYIEHKPAPPLDRFIHCLWYTCIPQPAHRRERILPSGFFEVILTLHRDFLVDCPEGGPERRTAPSLVVGVRSVYEIVDTSDMADLIGVAFKPGGFPQFVRDAAHIFSNRSVDLEDLFGSEARALRERLRELPTPDAKLRALETWLAGRMAKTPVKGRGTVDDVIAFALRKFHESPGLASVAEVARGTGWSQRRFSQLFREQVGLTPKLWCRIQRFQRAVRQLHAGANVRWSELAVDCGFYDQSHFANEFRAFSGIDATTYVGSHSTPWANHLRAD